MLIWSKNVQVIKDVKINCGSSKRHSTDKVQNYLRYGNCVPCDQTLLIQRKNYVETLNNPQNLMHIKMMEDWLQEMQINYIIKQML